MFDHMLCLPAVLMLYALATVAPAGVHDRKA
jgi:hypothetical protein